ncbi:IS21 family transposase, partial [Fluviibacterium sp. DFM31]
MGCGRSIRSFARAAGPSRNAIKKDLKDDGPPGYQRQAPPVRHKLCNGFDLRLQELFDQDRKRPRRERRTARKLYERLVVDGYTGSCSPVHRFVRDPKRAGTGSGEAFIPLHSAAGDALQCDWSEERVVPGGVGQKVKVAHFRLCHSRKPFVVACP